MRKLRRKMKQVLTICMAVLMVVETINCTSMSVSAESNATEWLDVSTGDAVQKAEEADKAAYDAAIAAEEALKAAEELAQKSEDVVFETTTDASGNDAPVLNDDLENSITDAEVKVEDANKQNADTIAETEKEVEQIASDALNDTQEQLTIATDAADKAEAEALKAQEALAKAQAASDYSTALAAANEAKTAASNAQKAAKTAKTAYDTALEVYEQAMKEFDAAVAAANVTVEDGDATKAAQEAIDAAQAAINTAQNAVDAAKAEYDNALVNKLTAEAASQEAMKQAGNAADAADDTVKKLEEEKQVDIKTATEAKETAEEALEAAKDALEKVEEEQDTIINELTEEIASYNEVVEKYDADKAIVDDMTKTELALLEIAANLGNDSAKEKLKKYDEAVKAIQAVTNITELREEQTRLQSNIDAAKKAKADAAAAVTNRTNELAAVTAALETVTNYIYSDSAQVTYMDKDELKQYQELLDELNKSYKDYKDSKELREEYEEAIDRSEGTIFDKFYKFLNELYLETVHNGAEITIDFTKMQIVYSNNGLTLISGKNEENKTTLIAIENGKLVVSEVDQTEFAAYSTTFDAVAAAQAAEKAANAAKEEADALARYEAAKDALKLAQERLDAAKLNKLNLDAAKAKLDAAKQNVTDTKVEWERAQEAADVAKIDYEEAKTEAETKPVIAKFYVLNRGLTQPSEVASYPKPNYTKAQFGELYSGVELDAEGSRDTSYLSLYKKGIKDNFATYIMNQPTAADFGITLKEGESITWYVIKTEADGIHVDGIITGQKFNITVQYGYLNDNNEFVEFTNGETTQVVGLGESFSIDSPSAESFGDSVVVADSVWTPDTMNVSGIASKDATYQVIYTTEETTQVTINYYRGSLTGTLLTTSTRDVAVSKAATYGDVVKANLLNLNRPTDCYDGVLINYVENGDGTYTANIVYEIIPQETPSDPTPTPDDDPITTVVIEENPVVLAATPTTPVVTTTVTPVQPTVVIEDEETPLAETPSVEEPETKEEPQEVVAIEDEETPLAASPNCWIHWLILMLTIVYTVYELIRALQRNKKIKEMQEDADTIEDLA